MSKLEFKNISYCYPKGDQALNDVSFCIRDNDCLGVIGDNGSGKTTLLKIISGTLYPDEGSIYIDDKNITDCIPQLRDLAFVYQTPILYPHLTIYQNLKMGLNYYNLSEEDIDMRIKKMLIKIKMTKKVNFKPRFLSEGEKQLVSLAKALIREPKILLLDEAFSHLDTLSKERCFNLIMEIKKERPIIIVYVDHDIKNITRIATRICEMENGSITLNQSVMDYIKKL